MRQMSTNSLTHLQVHAHEPKSAPQVLVVHELEGAIASDDGAQERPLHFVLKLCTGHVACERVLRPLALTRMLLALLILILIEQHHLIPSRRALACLVVLLGGLVGLREAEELAASLAPQHAWLQVQLLSNDDFLALLDGLQLAGLLQVALEVWRLPARALHELLPNNPIAIFLCTKRVSRHFYRLSGVARAAISRP